MSRHSCIIPGCNEDGRNALQVRCRRPNTSAVWAPSSDAWVCDKHSENGAEIEIFYRPKTNRKVLTRIFGVKGSNQGPAAVKQTEITSTQR